VREARGLALLDRPEIRRIHESKYSLIYEEAKLVKKALMLHAWIQEHRTAEIERNFLVWGGAIQRVAEEYGWLAEALARAAKAQKWSTSRQWEFRRLSWRIRTGVKEDLLPIAQLRVRGLGRVYLRRLADAGLADVRMLKAASPDQLRAALNHRGLAERLHGHLHRAEAEEKAKSAGAGDEAEGTREEEPLATSAASTPTPAAPATYRTSETTPLPCRAAEAAPAYRCSPCEDQAAIHFVGSINRRRYLVQLNDTDVWVPGQPFRILWLLASQRQRDPAGWIHISALGVPTNPHRAISRVRRLLRPYPGEPEGGWIENDGHGGYRLSPTACTTWDEDVFPSECPEIFRTIALER